MMFLFTIVVFCFFGVALYSWIDTVTNPPLPEQESRPQLHNAKKNIIIPVEVDDISDSSLKSMQRSSQDIKRIEEQKNTIKPIVNNDPIMNNRKIERVADYDTFYDGIRKNHKMKKYRENKNFLKQRKKLTLKSNQDDDNDNGPIKNL